MTGVARTVASASAVAAIPIWSVLIAGRIDLSIVLFSAALVAICLVYGNAFARATRSLVPFSGTASELLVGFFIVSSALFVLTLATPLGSVARAAIVGGASLLLLPLVFRHRDDPRDTRDEWASFACIAGGVVAAAIWTRDLQPLVEIRGDRMIFRAWYDLFIHAREIGIFAVAHGVSSLSDSRTAGVAAPLYHVASYMVPAVFTSLTGASPIDAFAVFQLPFGILLTSLGAYVLARPFFGRGPAVAAAFAIVMGPDAYQQGFGDRLLGYQFMTQVNLGMLYGLACISIGWVFVIEGCRRGRYVAVAVGWAFLGVCLTYKAHIFVANAFPMLIYPCLFFARVPPRTRLACAIAFTAIFVATIGLSQRIDRVPLIQLDGSGLRPYTATLLRSTEPSALRSWFDDEINVKQHVPGGRAAISAALVALSTFGFWIVVAPFAGWLARRRVPIAAGALPVIAVVNYFVMSLGLALDSRAIGTPEELVNRPFAWAYFVVVVFAVGAIARTIADALHDRRLALTTAAGVATAALVASSFVEARGLQTFPAWPGHAGYEDFNAVPVCYVRAAEYIRDHAAPDDVIQDSDADPNFVLTAIAQRQAFAIDAAFGGPSAIARARLDDVRRAVQSDDPGALGALMRANRIAWTVVRGPREVPETRTGVDAVLSCGDYRLYRVSR